MGDVIFGKVTKLTQNTTKSGKPYIKFCLTESVKSIDDKWINTWFHCTYWDEKTDLSDGQRAIVYGHNNKRTDKNDPDKTFNNFDAFHIEIISQTTKDYTAPERKPTRPPSILDDVPF